MIILINTIRMHLLIQWLATVVAIIISAYILPGVIVFDLPTALFAGLILSLINIAIKPIFVLLTLPLNILTLGLFTFIINGLLILLSASLVDGFHVDNIWWAILFSIILSLVTSLFHEAKKNHKH